MMSTKEATKLFKIVLGGMLIALSLYLTLKFALKAPPFMKILFLIANVATIYLVYVYLIQTKKDKKQDGPNTD